MIRVSVLVILLFISTYKPKIVQALTPGPKTICCSQLINTGEMTGADCSNFKDLTIKECQRVSKSFSRDDKNFNEGYFSAEMLYKYIVPTAIFVSVPLVFAIMLTVKKMRKNK